MSIRRLKTLYCISVIALALILAASGTIGYIAAIIMLTGALPMFRAVEWAASDQGADNAIRDLRRHWRAQQNERATPDEESDASAHRIANQQ